MSVHLIGSGPGGVVEIGAPVRFAAVLRVGGAAAADGTLAAARVTCPRRGCIDGAECLDCVHLQAFRAGPTLRLYCTVDDREPIAEPAMKELHIGCLPVVAGPLVVGIVTRRDLDRAGVPA